MVHLKSCECYYCHRAIQDTKQYNPFLCCRYCGRFKCPRCLVKNSKEGCGSGQPGCDLVFRTPYLDIIFHAPAEELKLLDFGKWSIFLCNNCGTPIVDRSQLRVYADKHRVELYCARCTQFFLNEHSVLPRPVCERNIILEKVYENILLEVKSFFGSTVSRPIKPKPLKLNSYCVSCNRTIEFTMNGSYFTHFNKSGETVCFDCSSGADFLTRDFGKAAFDVLRYLADPSDLKLLTYSKWVDLRCPSCFAHFSNEEDRLPMFHTAGCNAVVCKKCAFEHEKSCPRKRNRWSVSEMLFGKKTSMIQLHFLVKIIQELRGYFKNSGIDSIPSTSNDELGHGAHGCVRREAMAVKEFFCGDDAAMKRMAFREVEILKKLQHPNIVKYYDSHWDKNRNTMTVKMEMCGSNLRHYIGNFISHEIQVFWSHDLLSALLYMKEQRVHHRDIKPENILTVPTGPHRGSLKLCDFGLARVWYTGACTENQLCTRPYQDPEASLDPNNHHFESDLYSTGITLWEVVNRKHAHQFTHETEDGDPPILQLIYKCTEPSQESRISVEDAYAEIDVIKKRDVSDKVVNFDEVFNVRWEANDEHLQLSSSTITS